MHKGKGIDYLADLELKHNGHKTLRLLDVPKPEDESGLNRK